MGITDGTKKLESKLDLLATAASLLPTGGLSVGFGGYVGSSRLEPSITSTSDSPCGGRVWKKQEHHILDFNQSGDERRSNIGFGQETFRASEFEHEQAQMTFVGWMAGANIPSLAAMKQTQMLAHTLA
ncbi:hypothetical protein Tco_1066210 [Tanacetum coccineum]|uniref:Uncharacterized protein n=1 Tax=Tanacetum coccineum TaxID=301880 RepID=A0ABQ5H9U7_9ASTR